MISKLPIAWYRGCTTPEQKQKREELIRNSVSFSELFLALLSDKYETIEKKGFKEEEYENPSWMIMQAFRNGKIAALTEIADLFTHLKKDDS